MLFFHFPYIRDKNSNTYPLASPYKKKIFIYTQCPSCNLKIMPIFISFYTLSSINGQWRKNMKMKGLSILSSLIKAHLDDVMEEKKILHSNANVEDITSVWQTCGLDQKGKLSGSREIINHRSFSSNTNIKENWNCCGKLAFSSKKLCGMMNF